MSERDLLLIKIGMCNEMIHQMEFTNPKEHKEIVESFMFKEQTRYARLMNKEANGK